MAKDKKQEVCILVSTYNWPEALELCIRSIFNQTIQPKEIVIADDGSDEKTKATIDRLKQESIVPIVHIWHEDKGFRKTEILNKAIAKISSDYILQVDGDVILSPHFVSDHLDIAEKGFFVCGSRVKLSEEVSQKIIKNGIFDLKLWQMPVGFVLNSFRSKLLRYYLAERYARKIDHLRGCNMAFWKEDLVKVNGYNEDLTQWGHEDGEIAFRLHFAGVKKKALKMGGAVYHIHHKESSRSNEHTHLKELERVKANRIKWCENGLDKYLS